MICGTLISSPEVFGLLRSFASDSGAIQPSNAQIRMRMRYGGITAQSIIKQTERFHTK
jgi:hypothetical protein